MARRWRNPVGIEHLIAHFPCPGLVQGHDCREQKRHPNQSAGNSSRFFRSRIEREAEDHHHQQREKQHGVDGVLRSPLQAKVFGQSRSRDDSETVLMVSPIVAARSEVRLTICPASIHTNSSAAPSRSEAWWVTTKIVFAGITQAGRADSPSLGQNAGRRWRRARREEGF